MDILPIKRNDCREFGPLDTFLNLMKLNQFAYGVPEVIRTPLLNNSIQSISSAYEVQENPNNSRSNETVLESDLPGYTTPDNKSSASNICNNSATSASFNLAPSENQMLLCELLNSVSSKKSIASSSFPKLSSSSAKDYDQNNSIYSRRSDNEPQVHETASEIYNFAKTASFDDQEIARVVHDLVFEKYEESYNKLLNKLKKLHLSEKENRLKSVIVELESVLKKKNLSIPNRQIKENVCIQDTLETCSVDIKRLEDAALGSNIQTKMVEGVKQVYSSTDSELELAIKPIGIPRSGKLDKSFTKTTLSTSVNTESACQENLNIKNSNSNHWKLPSEESPTDIDGSIKNLYKRFPVPDVTQNSFSSPVFNVEAQVYTFNVDDRHKSNSCGNGNDTAKERHRRRLENRATYKPPDLHDDVTNLDKIEDLTYNSLYPLASPLVRTATNHSHMSDNVEYNEYNFLKAALGDELLEEAASSNEYIFPQTVSIGTDDISELLSSTSSIAQSRRRRCRNRKSTETISTYDKKSLSLCNTVLQKTTSRYQKSSTISGSFASYETITNFSQSISSNHQDKKLIKNKIFVHETIVDQAEKALEYGRRKSGFIGSPAHLEAERTLLVSKIRRQALVNTLYTIQDTSNDTHGRITIENLRCTLNTIRNNHHLFEQYYVCILQYKTTVYSTKIAAPNKLGWIDFGGCFIFDEVSNTFNIKIELHAIQLSQKIQKCFVLPFLRSASKLPMLKRIGESHIGIMNRKNDKFSLLYRDGERFREHKLTALIQTSIKWPKTLRGFLTIGIEKHEQQPIWNRRWCVLEHGKLKYYNYPSDENYCKPVGTVDMETCKSCDEAYRRYLKHKTLALFIDTGNEYKIYYLSPDSTEEFHLWHKNVDVVLKLIKEWNIF